MIKSSCRHIFFIALLNLGRISNAQNAKEFEYHLQSIDSNYFILASDETKDTVNVYREFVDYIIENSLDQPSDKYFISNRKLLPKLEVVKCDSAQIIFRDTLVTGEICEIRITTRNFIPENHNLVFDDKNKWFTSIDNQIPYGGNYVLPKVEIEKIEISVNGNLILIPKSAYRNLFEANICTDHYFLRNIEAYSSIDGQYIYIYIYGGNAASTYFSKLIFDKEKYLTRIIADYYPLSIHGSFRPDFLGF